MRAFIRAATVGGLALGLASCSDYYDEKGAAEQFQNASRLAVDFVIAAAEVCPDQIVSAALAQKLIVGSRSGGYDEVDRLLTGAEASVPSHLYAYGQQATSMSTRTYGSLDALKIANATLQTFLNAGFIVTSFEQDGEGSEQVPAVVTITSDGRKELSIRAVKEFGFLHPGISKKILEALAAKVENGELSAFGRYAIYETGGEDGQVIAQQIGADVAAIPRQFARGRITNGSYTVPQTPCLKL